MGLADGDGVFSPGQSLLPASQAEGLSIFLSFNWHVFKTMLYYVPWERAHFFIEAHRYTPPVKVLSEFEKERV